MTVLPRVTWPSPPIATAPLRRTATMVVPWGSNPLLSDIGLLICAGNGPVPFRQAPKLSSARGDGFCRRYGRGAGNQDGCKSGSSQYQRGPAAPARRANPHQIQEYAMQTNAGTGGGIRAGSLPAAEPSKPPLSGQLACPDAHRHALRTELFRPV